MMATTPWPDGRRCAVSLTYDDAVPVHHDEGAPVIEGVRHLRGARVGGAPA